VKKNAHKVKKIELNPSLENFGENLDSQVMQTPRYRGGSFWVGKLTEARSWRSNRFSRKQKALKKRGSKKRKRGEGESVAHTTV